MQASTQPLIKDLSIKTTHKLKVKKDKLVFKPAGFLHRVQRVLLYLYSLAVMVEVYDLIAGNGDFELFWLILSLFFVFIMHFWLSDNQIITFNSSSNLALNTVEIERMRSFGGTTKKQVIPCKDLVKGFEVIDKAINRSSSPYHIFELNLILEDSRINVASTRKVDIVNEWIKEINDFEGSFEKQVKHSILLISS